MTAPAPVADIDHIEERIPSKYWSLRCIIVEEGAYQNWNARNSLEIVSIKEHSRSFTGRDKNLFALQPEACRPGTPYVFSSAVSVDAAEQVMNGQGKQIEMAAKRFSVTKLGSAGFRGWSDAWNAGVAWSLSSMVDLTNVEVPDG